MKEKITLLFLALLFAFIRLPAINFSLHQDEYKWPAVVNPTYVSEIEIPHPPLGELIYQTAGRVVGFNVHFRFVPLFFGTMNLLLLYYLVRFVYGRREAVIASLIWIFSYFSVLASLMVDTDGEIMPFFFLLALIAYFKSRQVTEKEKYKWLLLLVVSCVMGVFIKLSFLLAIAALLADFLWSKKDGINKKDILRYIVRLGFAVIGLGALFVLSSKVFPFFNLSQSFAYWEHFGRFNRNWFQTAIQCVKVLLYASPILVLIPLFGVRLVFQKSKVFAFFLIFAFLFYIVLFDFSIGALDRYLQLVILPLTIMSSIIVSHVFEVKSRYSKKFLIFGIAVAVGLVILQFLPHYVPSLHPKAEWISRIVGLRWNFLYPFSGGSGPLGFYVSFLFMAIVWIISFGSLAVSAWKPSFKAAMIAFLIPLGIVYNLVFTEEYLFGRVNGHAPALAVEAAKFIQNMPEIQKVTVYNDNGGYEVMQTGKYRKRLYVDPKFDLSEKVANLNKYKEHYFVLDVPKIDPKSVYQKYFDSCRIIYKKTDKKMSAIIYDCRNVPDITL